MMTFLSPSSPVQPSPLDRRSTTTPDDPTKNVWDVFDDPIIQQRAIDHLHEVLEYISPERKSAYLEALEQCPHLVETESNPLYFLRFEKFNSWSASERLITYWNKRKELFGSDRAFRPIVDLSGNGALDEQDVNYIASGLELMMVTTDNIVMYDRTFASDSASFHTRMKMRFFFLQKLIEPCQQMGAGPRIFIRGFTINLARTRVNQETRILIEKAFPIPPIEEIHLAYLHEPHQTIWQYIVPLGIQQVAGLATHFKVHNCNSVDELAESFARHNISRKSLPVSLGGYYNPNVNFVQFLIDNGYPPAKLGEALESGNHRYKRRPDDLDHLVDYFLGKAAELPDLPDTDPFHPSVLPSSSSSLPSSLPSIPAQSLSLYNHDETQTSIEIDPPRPPKRRNATTTVDYDCSSSSHSSSRGNSPLLATTNTTTANYNRNYRIDIPTTTARCIPLSLSTDEAYLSDYQCYLRQQIEFFQATHDDVSSSVRGRNKPIVLGQVGIRCRHCAHCPRPQRCKAATYYPTKLDGIYQTALNLTRMHLMEACHHIPPEIRSHLYALHQGKSFMGTGKEYWSEAAQTCGIMEQGLILQYRS